MCGATCYALHDAVEAATTTHCSDARSSPHFVLRPAINCSDRAICHGPNDGATLFAWVVVGFSCRQRCRYAVAIVPHAGVVGDAIASGPANPAMMARACRIATAAAGVNCPETVCLSGHCGCIQRAGGPAPSHSLWRVLGPFSCSSISGATPAYGPNGIGSCGCESLTAQARSQSRDMLILWESRAVVHVFCL